MAPQELYSPPVLTKRFSYISYVTETGDGDLEEIREEARESPKRGGKEGLYGAGK